MNTPLIRYRARFINGAWVLFDTRTVKNLDTFRLQRDAQAAAKERNK